MGFDILVALRGKEGEGNSTYQISNCIAHYTFHIIRIEAENTLDSIDPVGWPRSVSSVVAAVISLPCITWY